MKLQSWSKGLVDAGVAWNGISGDNQTIDMRLKKKKTHTHHPPPPPAKKKPNQTNQTKKNQHPFPVPLPQEPHTNASGCKSHAGLERSIRLYSNTCKLLQAHFNSISLLCCGGILFLKWVSFFQCKITIHFITVHVLKAAREIRIGGAVKLSMPNLF